MPADLGRIGERVSRPGRLGDAVPIVEQKRSFGIADGLILVASVAVGLNLFRVWSPVLTARTLWNAIIRPRNGWSLRYAIEMSLELGMVAVAPLHTAITPACLIAQIRRPRLTRFRRRPGFVACLLATMSALVSAIIAVLWLAFFSRLEDLAKDVTAFGCLVSMVSGTAVLSGWGAMLLCRVWRPSPSWQDRAGRLVGAGWITLGVMGLGYVVLAVF